MPSTLLCILHQLHRRGRLQSCANALGDVNSLVPLATRLSHLDCLVLSAPLQVSLPFFPAATSCQSMQTFPCQPAPTIQGSGTPGETYSAPAVLPMAMSFRHRDAVLQRRQTLTIRLQFRSLESFKPGLVRPFSRHSTTSSTWSWLLSLAQQSFLDISSTHSFFSF